MSISISALSLQFEDVFGNVTNSQYKANAGDIITATFDIEENIYFESSDLRPINVTNQFSTQRILIMPDYESMNGFYVGQNVTLVRVGANPVVAPVNTTITAIDFNTLRITVASIGSIPSPSGLRFGSTTTLTIYSTDLREDLFINLNLTQGNLPAKYNSVASQTYNGYPSVVAPFRSSSIDGTNVRFQASLGSVIVGGTATFTQVGFKSGHIKADIDVERLADVNTYTRKWRFTIKNVQIGAHATELFDVIQPASYYFDFEWYSTTDLIDPTVVQWNLNPSNTGAFDEAYENGTFNSELTQGITTDLYYNAESTHTIIIESAESDITFGAYHKSLNPNYYQQKQYTQESLGMFLGLESGDLPLVAGIYQSSANPQGARYEIEINSITYVGTTHTINLTFRYTNQAFIDFMQANDATDRNITIWFKVGDVNHLVFKDNIVEGEKVVTTWDDIKLDDFFAIFQLDKTSDTYPATGAAIDGGGYFSTEDNAILRINGQLSKLRDWGKSRFQIVVVNTADDDDYFVLEEYNFDWSDVQVNNDGVALINKSVNIAENFPTTAGSRRQASVRYTGDNDTISEFTVRFQCPLILNWRYWIEQANAFVQFYPNQNKNYINYFDSPYTIAIRTEVENDTTIYRHDAPVDAYYDYDETFTSVPEEWQGTTEWEIYDEDNNLVTDFINGQVNRVLVRFNTVQTATDGQTWGQMTIEPFESAPRYLLSSNYNTDGDVTNPIIPLTGQTKLKKTVVSTTEVTFEALVDTTRLNGSEFKMTCKFYNDNPTKIEQVRTKNEISLITPQIIINEPEENDNYGALCCDVFPVFASNDNDTYKNDVSSAWAFIPKSGSLTFELYKDDVLATTQPTITTFVNESRAKYCTINWQDVFQIDGIGCYVLKVIQTNVLLQDTVTEWATYKLMEWTTENVAGFVNFRANFNYNQNIEGIDFSNSNVIDCINVYGFFGNRDPRTEIDNVVYNTRLQTSVKRENLNQYEFGSDPIGKLFTRKLLDLYFLSETDLYVTDNNAFNHEQYIYKRVIVNEVPKPEYYQYSRKAKVSALFGDKIVNQKTHF